MTFKIEMPTKDIPADPVNLSPALAAMMAQLIMPHQYAAILSKSVESVNVQCPHKTSFIEK